jgi:succinoglycan biosynthesis transport protein ExoP
MSTEPDLARSVGLDDYLGILRRRWRLIVAILSLAGVAAAVWSLERVPSYQATTSILIQPITSDQFDSQVRPDQLLNMTNEQQVVLSTPVAAKAVAAMRAWATPEELLERVSVDVPANSQILAIHFSDPAPRTAQLGADELAKAYLDVRAMGVKQRIKASVANLQRQIEALGQRRQAQNAILSRSTATPAERQSAQGLKDTLTQQITSLDQKIADLQQLNASPGAIIQPAVLPTTRTSPNHKVDLGIGLAIGLLAGVAAALVRDRIDLRLRGYEDLAERLGRPVLARVPPFPRWERSGVLGWRRRSGSESSLITLEQPNGLIAEAYRTLRIRLARLASQLDIKTVMVLSAGVGEGKSTTAANLAVVTAESGRSVLLVSADLRRPRIHELFALPNTSGLSNLLLDANEALSDDGGAETPPCDEEGTELASHVWSLTFNLWVITSGPPPPHPSSLMDSNAMRQFLKGRRDLYDVILLDCPPALLAADSLALAPLVDAILVVADAKVSSRSAVSQLGELLQQVGGTVIGSVLNRSRQPSGVRYDHEVE